MEYYAHSLEGKKPDEWQPLEEHLRNVAGMAAEFAGPFGGDQWAYLAGLWHDLGKYSHDFQNKLLLENGYDAHIETRPGRVVHSEAGGHLATIKGWTGAERVLSWLIMGHHAGLADFSADRTHAKALSVKMRDPERSKEILEKAPAVICDHKIPTQKVPVGADPSFFIRMLFSCVIDADFLDTEAFMDGKRHACRNREWPSLDDLANALDDYLDALCLKAKPNEINKLRADVLEQCRQKSDLPQQVFSLTVPTGGGKTLSSLAFALRHAVKHGKKRIIYVIPYTSIIEQTAGVFRALPGFEQAVLEHHGGVLLEDESLETAWSRLASENWNAPIIVTTNVQFFESLYGAKTSRCRKLHNIAESVVIFDEAQCLPPEYLRPAVFAIRELERYYHVTPVLCTATQPVLDKREHFDFQFEEGFNEGQVHEIISDPAGLSEKLKRVHVSLFKDELGPINLELLAEAVQKHDQSVLCILNRKDDCRKLAALLPEETTIHLSTNMCAAHRNTKLAEVRNRLNKDEPVRVVSTSLIEAGVDIDFPIVYRALTGIDSIAQAAGRCNREAKLDRGQTIVFVPERQPQYVRQPADISKELLQTVEMDELLSPETYRKYFRQRFWQLGEEALDQYGILAMLSEPMNYYFRSVSDEFRLIRDDWQFPAVVPYDDAQRQIDLLIEKPWARAQQLRRLQQYTINLPRHIHADLVSIDCIHAVDKYPGMFVLNHMLYSDQYGYVPKDQAAEHNKNLNII